MQIIKANNLGEAWKKSLFKIYKYGKIMDDDKGKIKELLDFLIIIRQIKKNDPIIKRYANKKTIKWMKQNFEQTEPMNNWGYSYGQRLYNFGGVNQIKSIIQKLKKNPVAKSATISLMLPPNDTKHVPCLVALDFKVRNKKLITTAFFRSQDIGKKFYADAIAIKLLTNKIAKALSIQLTEFVFFIKSAHFYLDDIGQLKDMLKL
ncbi:MAG: thymidylate synthase [Candidatus Pacebacteria bacterium]|nr:thymidylate synthase [Candidatus Paceibacterota bacterium]